MTSNFRPMSAEEYRAALAALGLNQTSAARLLRIGDRASRYYAAGDPDHPVPFPIAALLRLMLARRISPAAVERLNAAISMG